MTIETPRPTFRDPAGSLSFNDEFAVRTIAASAKESVLEFVTSPFCKRLQEQGRLIASSLEDSETGCRLLHPVIRTPTYPWEWTSAQWLEAAALTLTLCDEAIDEGWILKDATPLNILFAGSRPVMVDILSFERRDISSSLWLAYGQYVRTFLLPLVMNRLLSWPLALCLFKRDGYEPSEVYRALSWPQRFTQTAFWPITLPAWIERLARTSRRASWPRGSEINQEIGAKILKHTMKTLLQRTRRATIKTRESEWADYGSKPTHYTAEQIDQKHDWVRCALLELKPTYVLDIGANTGQFSTLAAEMGSHVVALERDTAAAEQLFHLSRSRDLDIQTIVADLSRPTPPVGWENSESLSLLSRLAGQFDMVLMLAVIHHLLLIEQIPLSDIISLCHRLTTRYLVIEWVPVSDPMYISLMRGRETLYGSLHESELASSCIGYFRLLRRQLLDNGRSLLLLERM